MLFCCVVVKSSTEAELVGVSDYASEVIHKRYYLQAQGYTLGNEPTTIWQDNTSTLAMIANGEPNSPRTRHIDIRYFFVKDRVDSGELCFKYKATQDMVADILTKPLQGELFVKLRDKL